MMRIFVKDLGAMICATMLGLTAADLLTSIIYQDGGFGVIALFATFVAMPVTLAIGLPLLWLLRWMGQVKFWVYLMVGLLFAFAGWSLFLWPFDPASLKVRGLWFGLFALLAGTFGSLILYLLTAKSGSSRESQALDARST